MECRNHPGVEATARCSGCAEPFCSNCLVEMGGRQYCGSCKSLAANANAGVMPEEATIPCKEANEALILAIIGIFCFGIILEPLALVKASKARKMMADNPRLAGSGKVTAATIIAIVALVLWVLGCIVRLAEIGGSVQ